MFKILGLSHIVFTVNKENIKSLKGTVLGNFYGEGNYLEFNHGEIRKNLIRNDNNLLSKITLFKSLNGDLPAIEFLYSNSNFKRPSDSYGLILKTITPPSDCLKNELRFGQKKNAKCIFDKELNLNIAYCTDLIEDDFGCWITVKDFDNHKNFLLNEKANRIISYENDMLTVKCRVLNSKFTTFTIVLIKEKRERAQNYYNDDLGLSTIGWFQKNFERLENYEQFSITHTFQISIFSRIFNAHFLYSNISISHELLNLH